jgi:hypothetical protein
MLGDRVWENITRQMFTIPHVFFLFRKEKWNLYWLKKEYIRVHPMRNNFEKLYSVETMRNIWNINILGLLTYVWQMMASDTFLFLGSFLIIRMSCLPSLLSNLQEQLAWHRKELDHQHHSILRSHISVQEYNDMSPNLAISLLYSDESRMFA